LPYWLASLAHGGRTALGARVIRVSAMRAPRVGRALLESPRESALAHPNLDVVDPLVLKSVGQRRGELQPLLFGDIKDALVCGVVPRLDIELDVGDELHRVIVAAPEAE
jgi:hypothetical protein